MSEMVAERLAKATPTESLTINWIGTKWNVLAGIGTRKLLKTLVGPNGLEPSTSSVSRMRSNQTELRAYMRYQNVNPFYASTLKAATPRSHVPHYANTCSHNLLIAPA